MNPRQIADYVRDDYERAGFGRHEDLTDYQVIGNYVAGQIFQQAEVERSPHRPTTDDEVWEFMEEYLLPRLPEIIEKAETIEDFSSECGWFYRTRPWRFQVGS